RDHFAQTNIPMRQSQEEEEKRQYMFDSLVAGTSLQESLLEQVRLSDFDNEQQQIAEMVIGNIDDHGYLQSSVDELAFATNILPEVFVHKAGDDFVVTTNNDHVPHLRISNTYKDLMAQADSSAEVREYIREKIRAGKFLIKSLHQRQQTIVNIAKEIVNRQREFMEKGVSCLKPLTMVQVAEVVGVHETTVSRAVSGKYMETPQGIFEMKYFFTAGIQTASGNGMSNTSVKDMIAEIFGKED